MPTGYRGGANNPQLSALWLVDRAQAKAIVLRVLRYYDGNVSEAARALKGANGKAVAKSTLTRWISDDPDLKAALQVIRVEARRDAHAIQRGEDS
jgi:hypothetical protein